MKKLFSTLLLLFTLSILWSSCGEADPNAGFPLDKQYWDPDDYVSVIHKINYETPDGEDYPRFDSPAKSGIIKKLTDHKNYEVILKDKERGVKNRNDISDMFMTSYKNMYNLYSSLDVQDKYIYPEELIAIEHFGLGLQLYYFGLGNEVILSEADDPESSGTLNVVNRNVNSLIGNYNQYLDHVDHEKAFNDEAIDAYVKGIDTYFGRLHEKYPDASYSRTSEKATLMLKKAESKKVQAALTRLIDLVAPAPADAE
jgi:hypothetical protein